MNKLNVTLLSLCLGPKMAVAGCFMIPDATVYSFTTYAVNAGYAKYKADQPTVADLSGGRLLLQNLSFGYGLSLDLSLADGSTRTIPIPAKTAVGLSPGGYYFVAYAEDPGRGAFYDPSTGVTYDADSVSIFASGNWTQESKRTGSILGGFIRFQFLSFYELPASVQSINIHDINAIGYVMKHPKDRIDKNGADLTSLGAAVSPFSSAIMKEALKIILKDITKGGPKIREIRKLFLAANWSWQADIVPLIKENDNHIEVGNIEGENAQGGGR